MPAAAAAAVAVFINGCQVLLPTAAFQRGDTVLVPVKGVFDRLGAKVAWSPESKQVLITALDLTLELTLGATEARLNGKPLLLQTAPELSEGSTMVPLRLVAEALGTDIAWDRQRRRVYVQTRPVGPLKPATIRDLMERPDDWAGRLVMLVGEYMGWQPSPFSPGTRNGVPVSQRDWVLRDATGEVYCRGDVTTTAPFALTPYSNVGRRLVVAGIAKLSRAGFIFLEPREIAEQPPPSPSMTIPRAPTTSTRYSNKPSLIPTASLSRCTFGSRRVAGMNSRCVGLRAMTTPSALVYTRPIVPNSNDKNVSSAVVWVLVTS